MTFVKAQVEKDMRTDKRINDWSVNNDVDKIDRPGLILFPLEMLDQMIIHYGITELLFCLHCEYNREC